MTKRVWAGLLAGILLVTGIATSASAATVTPKVDAQSAVVADVQTGQVLADKNGNERMPIASISKLLTVYLVEQAIKEGRLSMQSQIKVPASIVAISNEPALANVPLSTDRAYTIQELMEMALIKSANATALALGYAVSGTDTGVNQQIQDLLTSWGIKDTTIVSGAGLTNGDMGALTNPKLGADVENELSARELAIVGRHLVTDYPEIQQITSMQTAEVPSGATGTETIENSDKLLADGQGYKFTGLKTGYALSVHSTFIGLTTLEGRQVVTVVLGSDHTFSQTVAMLNAVKSAMTVKTLAKGTVIQRVQVEEARAGEERFPIATKTAVSMFVPTALRDGKLNMTIRSNNDMIAPIAKGHVVDHQETVFVDGGTTAERNAANDYLASPPKVDLIMTRDVAQASQVVQWYRDAKRVIMSLFE